MIKQIPLKDSLTLYDIERLNEKGFNIYFHNGKPFFNIEIEQNLKSICDELGINYFRNINLFGVGLKC